MNWYVLVVGIPVLVVKVFCIWQLWKINKSLSSSEDGK